MNTKRNLIQSCLLGASLLALPVEVQAQFSIMTNSGAITITGYAGTNGVVNAATNGVLTIPSSINNLPVTSIGFNAFAGSSLTRVTIPASVSTIGERAFASCSRLTNVTIPGSVNSIGQDAFAYCSSLTNVTIPRSVSNLGNEAFAYCYNLTGAYFEGNGPNEGPGLLYNAFIADDNLTIYYVPGTTGWGLFSADVGVQIAPWIPGSLEVTINPELAIIEGAHWRVDGGTLQNSGATVTNLSLGDHTVSFSSVSGWTPPSNLTVYVTTNLVVRAAGNYVQQTGSLQVAINPGAVIIEEPRWQVDDGAWENSGATVTGLALGEHRVTFSTVSGWTAPASQTVTIISHQTTLATAIYVPLYAIGSLQVTISPSGVVAAGAQWQVDGGTNENSGATVLGLSVGNHTVSFSTISGWRTPASQIISISANSTVSATGTYVLLATNYSSPFKYIINSDGTVSIMGYTGSGGSVTIPSTINGLPVTSIGSSAFQQSSLTSITIPDGVTSIGNNAFFGCGSLANAPLPGKLTSIGDGAFAFTGLTSISIPGSVTNIGDSPFGYSSLSNITISNGITSIGPLAFADTKVDSITIPNSVTNIGSQAFAGSFITNVALPDSLISIGGSAFEKSSLTSVTIPKSVTSVGPYAFSECISLTSITLPNSITSIAVGTFQNCSSLTNITIPNSVTSIGNAAFWECALTSVTIPNSVSSIGFSAFSGAYDQLVPQLTSVTIGKSVTNIGDFAFAFCPNLTSVYFEGNAPTVGAGVFASVAATAYFLPGTSGWSLTFADLYAAMLNSSPAGSLQVSITPPSAIASGARWQVDGGTLQSSGVMVSNLSVGNHTLSFTTISGWTTPDSQIVSVGANSTAMAIGTYTLISLSPVVLSAPQMTSGNTNLTFVLSGASGNNYVLQVSTNLSNWNSISTSTIPVSGSITLSTAVRGYNHQFYRAYLQ